jgi:hypothetical protein
VGLDRRKKLVCSRYEGWAIELDHALRIDKAVCGLDDLRPVGTRVEHALWIMPLGTPLVEQGVITERD